MDGQALRAQRRANMDKHREVAVYRSAKSRFRMAVSGVDPLVAELARLMKAYPAYEQDIARKAGISARLAWAWRMGISSPNLGHFRALLEATGYTLKIVKKEGDDAD